jgi:HSP20 family protein
VGNGAEAARQMDRWMQQLFGDNAVAGEAWSAPLAAWEDAGHWHVEADLPGVKADQLELVVHQGKLRLAFERKAPEGEAAEARSWYQNRRFGKFETYLNLPDTIDADSIQAELKDGVLHVSFAKRAEAQPKKVEVKIG